MPRLRSQKKTSDQVKKVECSAEYSAAASDVPATKIHGKRRNNRWKAKGPSPSKKKLTDKSQKGEEEERWNSSSDESEEWEDVESLEQQDDASPSTSAVSEHQYRPMEINISPPKSKKETDAETALRREVNRFRKQQQEELHKAHLLCHIAHGIYLSDLINDPLTKACALSLIPEGFVRNASDCFVDSVIERFTKWARSAFVLRSPESLAQISGDETFLMRCFDSKTALSQRELAVVFVCLLRSLGLDARLVFSCTPAALKPEILKDAEKKPTTERKTNKGKKPQVKQARSTASEEYYWAELFLDNEERWMSIDCKGPTIDKYIEIEAKCPQPVHYVLGVDNENGVKDLTARYSSGFLSAQIRRMRAEKSWWEETLWKFRSVHRQRDRLEEMQIHSILTEKPLPNTVSEFKNHPLYVLKRDLLKFEAIYPPDTKPVGFIRKEPVYSRSVVHTLHSEQSWLKEARLIRVGEEPYKTVQARPKMGLPKDEQETDRPLPLFGFWQTEPYVPQPVVNGVIPRNEFGNVQVFKPSMIPPGTVHLHVPGLLQVAKKLDIDCVPAMIGWEFHGRGSHPVLDGWIVCEEHKETLLAAWDHVQAVEDKRNRERRQERALQNWKRLIKGLLLRNAMRRKFQAKRTSGPSTSDEILEEEETENTSDRADTSHNSAWPQCKHRFGLEDS